MKKAIKNIFIILIAAILIVAPLLSCYAKAEDNICPKIDIKGFMNATIYADKNDNTSEQLWPPTSDKIKTLVKNIINPLAKLSLNRDWNAFAMTLSDEINVMLGDLWLDENGEVTNSSGPYMVYPPENEVTKDGEYSYVYDWRIDPYEAAEGFNDFINYIAEASGCEKVVIECHSYAGIVTMCYFEKYGTDAVRSVCFNSTAVYGAGFTKDIIKGKLLIGGDRDFTGMGAEAIVSYLLGTFSNNRYNQLIEPVIDMLKNAGLVDFVSKFFNTMLINTSDTLYKESIIPLFGFWPAIWSMVPDDSLEDGLDYIFSESLGSSVESYAGMNEKITAFSEGVRSHREDILGGINDDCNLYVISRYGYSSIPITASWQTMTDGVLDTASTSFGATCSNYGDMKVFDITSEYVSPNGQIDTSTCLFPEQTWMLRGIGHTQHFDTVQNMAKALLYYDGQATVKTFSEYPRFMLYSSDSGLLIPDPGIASTITFFEKIRRFFIQIFEQFKNLFR